MSDDRPELYFSVDVEANGPIPGPYSMTALGCVVVGRPDRAFYAELQPITDEVVPAAEAVSGLTLDYLRAHGERPGEAMARFGGWVTETAGADRRPVFVALNAAFDWMFVHWYFITYAGENPFGIGGLDIKAYYMGKFGVPWAETSSAAMAARLGVPDEGAHHALEDARAQVRLFERMLHAE
jgi:DNA polymerase III epsilon subunit-like protein